MNDESRAELSQNFDEFWPEQDAKAEEAPPPAAPIIELAERPETRKPEHQATDDAGS
jgi:hypothetical protein